MASQTSIHLSLDSTNVTFNEAVGRNYWSESLGNDTALIMLPIVVVTAFQWIRLTTLKAEAARGGPLVVNTAETLHQHRFEKLKKKRYSTYCRDRSV